MFLKIELNSLTFFKVQFSILDCSLDNNEIKKQFPRVFSPKQQQQQHIEDRNLSIYIHIRNVKKVWKSDKNKKLPKIKALILLKFPS